MFTASKVAANHSKGQKRVFLLVFFFFFFKVIFFLRLKFLLVICFFVACFGTGEWLNFLVHLKIFSSTSLI